MVYKNILELLFYLGIILCVLGTANCQVTIVDCPLNQEITTHRAYWEPPTVNGVGVTLKGSHTPGSIFPNGVTLVSYTAEDQNGNTDNSCEFTITVNNNNAPTVQNCPSVVHQTTGLDEDLATVTWTEPTATAINGDALTWSFRSSGPGDEFRVGETEVFYEFVDSENNGALCEFIVNVTAYIDDVPPGIDCPGDLLVIVDEGVTEVNVSWTELDPMEEHNVLLSTHEDGSAFEIGDTYITYLVEDTAGNVAFCEFVVTVRVDEPPMFTYCPDDINEVVGPLENTYVVTWNTPTAIDTETAMEDIEITSDGESPYTIDVETSTTITYTATDEGGYTATCSFTITVSRDGVPTFLNCPTDIEVEMTGVNTAVTWTEPTVTDDSVVTSNYDPGDMFTGPADYTVTYNAVDSFQSRANCTFHIKILDTTPPTIQGCPGNIVRTVTNQNTATVTWTEPTADDNSGQDVTIVSDIKSGATFTNGQTLTVTYTATDRAGLQSTCDFTVRVTGTTVCSDNPCLNDGVCVTVGEDGFECICVDDYSGETCSDSGLSTIQLIAISLGSVAGLLILLLLFICCCYYCCFAVYEEDQPPQIVIHRGPEPYMHMGVGILPEPRPAPLPVKKPLGERFHNSLPKKSTRKKIGKRFRHRSFGRSRVKDKTTGHYGKQQNFFT